MHAMHGSRSPHSGKLGELHSAKAYVIVSLPAACLLGPIDVDLPEVGVASILVVVQDSQLDEKGLQQPPAHITG